MDICIKDSSACFMPTIEVQKRFFIVFKATQCHENNLWHNTLVQTNMRSPNNLITTPTICMNELKLNFLNIKVVR